MIFEHKSVLLMETVDSLNVKPDGIYVDGTLGGGGIKLRSSEATIRISGKCSLTLELKRWMAFIWILVCLHTSWIRRTVDSLTERMPRWI